MTWTLRPEIDIELDCRGPQRYRGLSCQHVDAGRELLRAVKAQIPALLAPLADGVRLRTRGRFQGEALDLAQMHGASWRDVVLANVSYDLAPAPA